MRKLIGHDVSDAKLQKVASLAQRLFGLQPSEHSAALVSESHVNGGGDGLEFGADLIFRAPARFLVDGSLEDEELMEDESTAPSPFHEGWYNHSDASNYQSAADARNFNLSWLRDACDRIVRGSISQLSQDDLAMAICRVLDSEKPGEEVMIDDYFSPSVLVQLFEHISQDN